MIVLHAHWHPVHTPADVPGLVLWAETADGPAPARTRGRRAARPRAKTHPFCLSPLALRAVPFLASVGAMASEEEVTLQLPTTLTGPQPSPELWHEWDLDSGSPASLAPWAVVGLWLAPEDAVATLVGLPGPEGLPAGVRLGADVRFWQHAAALVLETVAAEKMLPGIVPMGDEWQARWIPVLDAPEDASRMAGLAAAMPAVARAEVAWGQTPDTAEWLLGSFVYRATDAVVRASSGGPPGVRGRDQDRSPEGRWVQALLADDPRIPGARAPLESLVLGYEAWTRELDQAGDATFRVAFRLEAPPAGIGTGLDDEALPADTQDKAGADSTDDQWRLHYLLQARDDPSLIVPADEVWRTKGRVLARLGRRFDQPQERLLAALGHASRLYEPLAGDLRSPRPAGLALSTADAYSFLRQAAPALEAAGFAVLVPPWWNRPGSRLGLRLKLRQSGTRSDGSPADAAGGEVSFDRLVGFEWQVALGDTPLSRAEFEALVALKTPLLQIRGQWVSLDPDQVEAAIQFWDRRAALGDLGLLDAVRLGLGAESAAATLPVEGVDAEGALAGWLARLTGNEALCEVPAPSRLLATLRPYQHRGLAWLDFLSRAGLGACLADDMGLGKTIQTLALLLHVAEGPGGLPGPSLLVSPTSVVANWEREMQRFAPDLRALVHQGPERLRDDALVEAATASDVVLTSYAVVRRDAQALARVPWHAVVADEAQNLKNPQAQQTRAVRRLPAQVRIALTGTPVENRLSELWSIMHFLNPGYLGPLDGFRREFAVPIERYGDGGARERLRTLVGPFILRRLKSDPTVIADLPAKVETKVYCHLTPEQATLYQAVVQDAMEAVASSEGIERKGLVLAMLAQLKAVCNHPLQFLHQRPADGSAADAGLAARSGKLQRLQELLEEVLAAGDRALLFTQFAEMGHLIHDWLPGAMGCGALYLHGGVPAARRAQMVDRFQAPDGPPVFVLSLKAGGTGLNLTRATHVFHFDRWWNPAVEDQATDRAYRIGQQRNVQVHKFVTLGTMEEMIDDMIERKKALADAVVGTGEAWLTELSTEALRDLVRLRTGGEGG